MLRVAASPQQQGDVWQPVGEHLHAAADQVLKPDDGRIAAGLDLVDDEEQAVKSAVERERQQVLLAVDVVVDR